jgi:hypothetical protein
MNLNDNPRGGTMCLGKAGIGIGGTDAKTLKIAAPNGAGIDYAINGIVYHKADAADALAMTAAAAQADLTTCIYLVCLDSSGTLSTVKGTAVLTAHLTGGDAVLEWPEVPDNKCAIGAVKIATSGGTFTAGTTELSAAAVTDTYYDLFCVPVAPLTA